MKAQEEITYSEESLDSVKRFLDFAESMKMKYEDAGLEERHNIRELRHKVLDTSIKIDNMLRDIMKRFPIFNNVSTQLMDAFWVKKCELDNLAYGLSEPNSLDTFFCTLIINNKQLK